MLQLRPNLIGIDTMATPLLQRAHQESVHVSNGRHLGSLGIEDLNGELLFYSHHQLDRI
jgi:hypothetical protein